MKLLIADDDPTSRTILKAISKKWDYQPIIAEDGEVAWQILQSADAPLLLLIDWEMPRLDGLGLCQRIRQQDSNNPPFIILLTARNETYDVVAGLEAGANEYIVKPFSYAELQARLQVGRRILELQSEVNRTYNILAFEQETITNIILKMRRSKPFDATRLRKLEISLEKTSGDVLLSAFRPNKTRHIMLGDFTGHGLMAAMGAPMVYDIFYTMTAKNFSMQKIITEMNKQLLEKMPTNLFLGAIFIELDAEKRLSTWNCGMSDILIYRKTYLWKKTASHFLALGIIEQNFNSCITLKVETEDRIYAYSDGIIEEINANNEEFGQQQLEQILYELLTLREKISFVGHKVNQFRGEMEQCDDIILMELTC